MTGLVAALAVVVTLLQPLVAGAADLVVLCPNALATAVSRVAEEHRTATSVGVRLMTGTAGGLASEAAAGAAADVIISTTAAVTDLEVRGIARAGTRTEVGVIFIGVAVRTDLDARPSYSAGVLAATAAPDAARALIERLLSASRRAALASVGFDPREAR